MTDQQPTASIEWGEDGVTHSRKTPTTDLAGATLPGDHWAYSANPGEFAARWNAASEYERQRAVDGINRQSQVAFQCHTEGHKDEITFLRQQLAKFPQEDV